MGFVRRQFSGNVFLKLRRIDYYSNFAGKLKNITHSWSRFCKLEIIS